MTIGGVDALSLAQELIRCQSVTPVEGGTLDVLCRELEALGFVCHRQTFTDDDTPPVENLYARWGTESPNICFAGHVDVVPVGDLDGWTVDPFAAEIKDGFLYGRGASDMKAAVACMVAAASRVIPDNPAGSISMLITCDEEGPAINGTKKMLDWMQEQGEQIDACVVGEPTNPQTMGEMMKIGRRGSFTGWLTVDGTQGHIAYPHLADNPVPRLIRMLDGIINLPLDEGNDHFQASNLEVTTIDVGNPATNIIPAAAKATFNIRYNTEQHKTDLESRIRAICDAVGGDYHLKIHNSGDPFLTPPGNLSGLVAGAVEAHTGIRPDLSTTGGTSDARFIKDMCPVVEFGLTGQTMHKVDECCTTDDVVALANIYTDIIRGYLG